MRIAFCDKPGSLITQSDSESGEVSLVEVGLALLSLLRSALLLLLNFSLLGLDNIVSIGVLLASLDVGIAFGLVAGQKLLEFIESAFEFAVVHGRSNLNESKSLQHAGIALESFFNILLVSLSVLLLPSCSEVILLLRFLVLGCSDLKLASTKSLILILLLLLFFGVSLGLHGSLLLLEQTSSGHLGSDELN